MRKRVSMAFLFIIVLIFGSIVWGQSKEENGMATFYEHTEEGTSLIRKEGTAVDTRHNRAPVGPYILWSRCLAGPIYHSTANAMNGHVIAGNNLNAPTAAEFYTPGGGGIPEWTYGCTNVYVAAADDDFTMAAVDDLGGTVRIHKWTGPGDGTPDWSVTFPGRYFGGYGPYVAVSRDGSTIAAILTKSDHPELVVFDGSSSTPIADKQFEDLDFPRLIRLSSNGRFVAFRAGTAIMICDRDLRRVREQIDLSYSSTPLDISGNGDLIAYGWSSLVVRQWTGQSYRELWDFYDTYMVGSVSISADGSTIVTGWYSPTFRGAKVTVHSTSSPEPLWTYHFQASTGVYQEMIKSTGISDNGRFFIIGSLGDADNLNPEVHVFNRDAGSTPFCTVDMPGSVNSVDISPDGRYASACGKHIHANQIGNGGDIAVLKLADISVTSPTGGENYATGQSMPIAWTSTAITGNVKVLLVRSDKTGGYIVAPSVPYDSSPINYTIPGDVMPGHYFIRVKQDTLFGRSADFSIGNITIH